MSIKDFRPSILISSGGTIEHVDNIRVMSNISTGITGATIAEMFLANGWEVFYVHGVGAKLPSRDIITYPTILHTTEITSAKNAMDVILDIAPNVDSCIMALAVSDFTFDISEDIKLSSSDTDGFIDYLRKTIRPNVKILPMIKSANPNAFVMGFKYTVGVTEEDQIAIAHDQNIKNKLDATFVNDDVMMHTNGTRSGMLVINEDHVVHTISREDTAKAIYGEVCVNVMNIAMGSIERRFMDIKNPWA